MTQVSHTHTSVRSALYLAETWVSSRFRRRSFVRPLLSSHRSCINSHPALAPVDRFLVRDTIRLPTVHRSMSCVFSSHSHEQRSATVSFIVASGLYSMVTAEGVTDKNSRG